VPHRACYGTALKYSTCFGQVYCPPSAVSQHCIHAAGIRQCQVHITVSSVGFEFVSRLSSLTMCSLFSMKNSSSSLPLLFVITSFHVFDLALLSVATSNPFPLANYNMFFMLLKSSVMSFPKSRYMLTAIKVLLPWVTSNTTMSSSDIWCTRSASINLLLTTMAALFFPCTLENILYFREILVTRFW